LTGKHADLDFFIHFCPDCRSAEEKTARLKAKEEVAEGEVVKEAA